MKNLFLFPILIVLLAGCREDINEITQTISETDPPIIIDNYIPTVDLITGTVVGVIYDENKDPVENALVKLRNQNYITDEYGRFVAKDVELDGEGTFYTVEKEGFFKGSRRFFPQAGAISYSAVELLPLKSIGKFDASAGATLVGANDFQIVFPAYSIKNNDGSIYDGIVDVAAQWLDPSASNIHERMPGSLQGISSEFEEVSLATYGMMSVELFGSNGEALNIADGKLVELSFPLPEDLLQTAPEEIPLWSFDDDTYGLWIEDGTAILEGNRYVGSVSHFSFWNCDDPFPLVTIKGRLVTSDGEPLVGYYLSVSVEGSSIASGGTTDDQGVFCGKMPKNETLIFKLYQNPWCYSDYITYSLGPFSSSTNIGDLVVDPVATSLIEVTGSIVDCSGAPVTEGWITYDIFGYSQSQYFNGSNGFNLIFLNCGDLDNITLQAYDSQSSEASTLQTTSLVVPITDLGSIAACGNTLDYYLTLTINGETHTYPNAGATQELPTGEWTSIYANGDTTFFSISLTDGSVGISDTSNLESINLFVAPPIYSSTLGLNCQSQMPNCLSDLTTEITSNTGQDGIIEGQISGVGDFIDDNGITITDVPFSAIFHLELD